MYQMWKRFKCTCFEKSSLFLLINFNTKISCQVKFIFVQLQYLTEKFFPFDVVKSRHFFKILHQ